MSIQIQWRHGSAASWTSTNPILAVGEVGVETDTGQFKIGIDGLTSWMSLSYAGATGPSPSLPYRSLGDGSDGNVTIASGVTTLSRDMFYNNLVINGTGSIDTNNYKIFVKGVLDLTAAPAGAINNNGLPGNAASGATQGATLAVPVSGTLGTCGNGSAGGAGSTGNGSNGTAGGSSLPSSYGNGGTQNAAGAAGAGGTGTAGTGAAGGSQTSLEMRRWETNFLKGVNLIGGGVGGGGGGGGGGDGTNSGGGGGGGGQGGGVVAIYANTIIKSSATSAAVIQSNGGNGGSGGYGAAAGITGGGGGGTGGAGGWIIIFYNNLVGPTIGYGLQAGSGSGGVGGNGYGFVMGAATGKGGAGGGASNAGRITLFNIQTNAMVQYLAAQDIGGGINPELNGSAAVGSIGGYGGIGQMFGVSF